MRERCASAAVLFLAQVYLHYNGDQQVSETAQTRASRRRLPDSLGHSESNGVRVSLFRSTVDLPGQTRLISLIIDLWIPGLHTENPGIITTALKVKHHHSAPRAPTTTRFSPFNSPIHWNSSEMCTGAIGCSRRGTARGACGCLWKWPDSISRTAGPIDFKFGM